MGRSLQCFFVNAIVLITAISGFCVTAGADPTSDINQIYLDLLGRSAEPGGLSYWVNRSNQTSLGRVRWEIAQTPEANSTFSVRQQYYGLFSSKLDAAGLQYWKSSLDQSSVSSIRTRMSQDPGVASFINQTYLSLFGGPADPAGNAYWQSVLAQKSQSSTSQLQQLIAQAGGKSTVVSAFPIRGVNYLSLGGDKFGSAESDSNLERLAKDGVNEINFNIFYAVEVNTDRIFDISTFYKVTNANDSTKWAFNHVYLPAGLVTATQKNSLAHAIQKAKSLGMKANLKLDFLNTSDAQPLSGISFDPSHELEFFQDYKAAVLNVAKFAQQNNVNTVFIGCEMGAMLTGQKHFAQFADAIAAARSVYAGKLSYAAIAFEMPMDWYSNGQDCSYCKELDEAYYVSFWHLLDIAGFDVYPGLTTASNPSLSDLQAAMGNSPALAPDIKVNLYSTTERFNTAGHLGMEAKFAGIPVVFSEVGAFSRKGAGLFTAGTDWNNPGPVDLELQKNLYIAMFGEYAQSRTSLNLQGFFIWAINAYDQGRPVPYPQALPAAYIADEGGFGFIGKPAEDVVRYFYRSYQP